MRNNHCVIEISWIFIKISVTIMKLFKLKKIKKYKSTVLAASSALFAAHVLRNSKKVIKKVKIRAYIELCISNFQRLYSIQFSPWCLPLIYLCALCKSLPFLSPALMIPFTKYSRFSRFGYSLWPVPRKKYFPPVLTLPQRVGLFFGFFFGISWKGNSVHKHEYKITGLFYTFSLKTQL